MTLILIVCASRVIGNVWNLVNDYPMIRTPKTTLAVVERYLAKHAPHCGNCAHFECENVDGDGWCDHIQDEMFCEYDGCDDWVADE